MTTLLALSLASFLAQTPARELSVVVATGNDAKELSLATVSDVFLTRRQFWANHAAITLVLLADDDPLHEAFCTHVLKRSPAEFSRLLLQQRYRGQLVTRVVRVDTPAELARVVAADPSSIGYLPAGPLPGGLKEVARVSVE